MNVIPLNMAGTRELRDYQVEAIDLLKASLRSGHRRPILQAPTAFGKTVLASHVMRMALAKGSRVVFTVPAISLVDQTVQSFWKDGISDVGVIQANHDLTDWSRPVQVASVQTLARRKYPEANLVIVDECHRHFKTIETWMEHEDWLKIPFIGLSATPWTVGLGNHYDDLIITQTTQQLIDAGYLSNFRVFAAAHPDLSSVKTVAGDYHEAQLAEAMQKGTLVADIVETWIRLGEDRPTLCFGVDRAHAKAIQQRFLSAGVSAGYQDMLTTPTERTDIKRDFHSGKLQVVCNVGTLTTGVDWDVRCIILARPTRSETLYVQIIGRGLRTADGKENCLILDHSDTTQRLGFVTDIHHYILNTGEKGEPGIKREALPKECSKCTLLMPPHTMKCPSCGHEKKPPASKIVEFDGQLTEMSRLKKDRQTSGMMQLRGREIPLDQFYGELLSYALLRAYRPGWAAHKYQEATGAWPKKSWTTAIPASAETLSWIKSRQIAWAKRRDQSEARV